MMQTASRRTKTATLGCTLFLALSTFLALCLGAASPVRAQADLPTFGPLPCPGHAAGYPSDQTICTMTIEIFNDDPNHFIFPVLEMGQGAVDQWMQAWFGILNTQLGGNPFPRNNTYRIYINPAKGIAPNTGVTLAFPLFTALKPIPNPMNQAFSNPGTGLGKPDTFIEWWSGGNIQLYTTQGTAQVQAPQPPSLRNAMLSSTQNLVPLPWNPSAPPLPTAGGPPTCTPVQSKAMNSPPPAAACEPLVLYMDTAGLLKNGGSQLLEYTLGAVNANIAPPHAVSWINYWMDTHNVDFDISYVDLAWMPGVMGVFGNDQVGYTGTPQSIDDFKFGKLVNNVRNGGLANFKNTQNGLNNVNCCWPQFRDNYTNIKPPIPGFTYLKFPSPIDAFATLSAANPPTDFDPPITQVAWDMGPPASLSAWKPIQALYNNWITSAGAFNAPNGGSCPGTYKAGTPITTWCTAMIAQKTILIANYQKYLQLFANGKCQGTTVTLSDALLIGHLYGFTPWIESADGIAGHGCLPAFNLLQDTTGYCVDKMPGACPTASNPAGGDANQRDYTNYGIVKMAFDNLNYGPDAIPPYPNPGYTFNPWVTLIHGASPNLAMPCSYAYSVDDAQGNIQAEGQGFIVDIAATVNLENQQPCSPPINISLGYNNPPFTPRFYKYAVCQNTPDRIKPVIPGFASFIISAQNPKNCPIYLWDTKNNDTNPSGPPLGQMYAFTINADPNNVALSFPLVNPPINWSTANHLNVGCKLNSSSPYSSQIWCCNSLASSGVFAYSVPVVASHQTQQFTVSTIAAMTCTDAASCQRAVGNSKPCNTNQ